MSEEEEKIYESGQEQPNDEFWLGAVYNCLRVRMTQKLDINLHSPDDIREESQSILKNKNTQLCLAFWMLTLGLIAALMLFIIRSVLYPK